MIGQTIGTYRIESQLGRGGMGVVYKATDVELERPVAIKMLPAELATDPPFIERFRAEARAQATLNHPNIAGLYGLFQHGENYFMVMEYVSGKTIADLIQQTGPVPYQKAIPWLKQALLGISVAHRRGIIHRDIKPQNLMVTDEGLVKVMDFGIARATGGRRLTGTGVLVGTLPYMSPEQVQGKDPDLRTDIYALGVTLYEMATGRLPFDSQSDFHLMKDIVETPPPPPRQFYPYIPEALEAVILKALAKDPGARYQSVEEFGVALEVAERETVTPFSAPHAGPAPGPVPLPGPASPVLHATQGPEPGPVQPPPPTLAPAPPLSWVQHLTQNPKWLIAAGAVILLLIVLVAGIAYLFPSTSTRTTTTQQGGGGSGSVTGSTEKPYVPGEVVTPPDQDQPVSSETELPPVKPDSSAGQPTVTTGAPASRPSRKTSSPPANRPSNAEVSGSESDTRTKPQGRQGGNTAEKIGDTAEKIGGAIKSVGGWFKGGKKKKDKKP